MGYASRIRTLDLTENINWNIKLRQVPFTMKEIVINSINKEEQIFGCMAAQTNIDPAQVQRQSAALGEPTCLNHWIIFRESAFRATDRAISQSAGAEEDQNLILLDEAPIFNPSHLLGLFTPIIPEAIKHTEVYRADFPVQYGGRSIIGDRHKGTRRKYDEVLGKRQCQSCFCAF